MSVLVLGASGFLGSIITDVLRKKLYGLPLIARGRELDITDYEKVYHLFLQTKPKYCINAAALSNPDTCERFPHKAYNLNVLGALNVAKLSQMFKCYLIHFSTDYVFNGSEQEQEMPYTEKHKPCPLQVYGKTKDMCENVTKNCSTIIRLSYLYGFHSNKTQTGFIFNTAQALIARKSVMACNHQLRHFTYVEDIADLMLKIIQQPIPIGIYHFAHPIYSTKYRVAKLIRQFLALQGYQNLGTVMKTKMISENMLKPESASVEKPIHCALSNDKLNTLIPGIFTDLPEGIALSVRKMLDYTRSL